MKLQNLTLLIIVLLVYAISIPGSIFVNRQEIFEIWDGLGVGLAAGVLIGFAPACWRALRPPIHDLITGDYLITGVSFTAIGIGTRLAGQWYWRGSGKPNWWIDSTLLLYSTITIVIGLGLILLTTSSHKGILMGAAYTRTIALGLFSVLIASIMIWYGWG